MNATNPVVPTNTKTAARFVVLMTSLLAGDRRTYRIFQRHGATWIIITLARYAKRHLVAAGDGVPWEAEAWQCNPVDLQWTGIYDADVHLA